MRTENLWSNFAPMEASVEPLELKVAAKSGNLTVKDVLIGEVWLCSGQSNMEFMVKQADNFADEKKDSDYPHDSAVLRRTRCRTRAAEGFEIGRMESEFAGNGRRFYGGRILFCA